MGKLLINLLLLLCFLTLGESHLKINKLEGPNSIEIGSKDDLVLDCIYEVENEDGLEIKWFYDDQQIYQWIPRLSNPRGLGKLSSHIDLKYKATDKEDDMYRALRIKNLTLDLSGNYTCKVSSYYNEQTKTRKLIIYEPIETMSLTHFESSDTVICEASGVNPKPVMKLYILGSNNTLEDKNNNNNKTEMDNENLFGNDDEDDDVLYVQEEDGDYNATDTLVYEEYNLPYPTNFICELTIPGTDYKEVKTIVYYPGGAPTTPTTDYEFDIPTNATENIIEESNGIPIMPRWSIVTLTLMKILSFYIIL